MEQLLTPKEVGEIIGLRRSKIQLMLATGELPSIIVSKGGRRRIFRIRPADLQKWLRDREVRSS